MKKSWIAVIGLLLIREYDKIQEEKEQQNEQK